MADSATRRDPYLAFCFKVTIQAEGLTQSTGFFKSVGGLSYETEVVDYREGGANNTTVKLVGATKWKNIVLKRGFCGPELIAWREKWLEPAGPKTRVSGTIEQLDTLGAAKATWTFVRAWPVKWELSELDASKNEVSIETLEIAHEGLTRS
jgi:phage tail-like protein